MPCFVNSVFQVYETLCEKFSQYHGALGPQADKLQAEILPSQWLCPASLENKPSG